MYSHNFQTNSMTVLEAKTTQPYIQPKKLPYTKQTINLTLLLAMSNRMKTIKCFDTNQIKNPTNN